MDLRMRVNIRTSMPSSLSSLGCWRRYLYVNNHTRKRWTCTLGNGRLNQLVLCCKMVIRKLGETDLPLTNMPKLLPIWLLHKAQLSIKLKISILVLLGLGAVWVIPRPFDDNSDILLTSSQLIDRNHYTAQVCSRDHPYVY